MKLYMISDEGPTDNKNTNEILTLFYDETDSKYFQGKTNINKGKEYLPYEQRFIYEDISEKSVQELSEKNNIAFIVNEEELPCFDDNEYDINEYGDYYMIYKKTK